MAGIGFELRKILKEDSFFALFKSFISSLVFVSGPWLITMMNLILVFFVAGRDTISHFVIITHVLASSLIFSSPVQTLVVRYVSDREFLKEENKIFPNFIGAITTCFLIGIIISSIFFFLENSLLPLDKFIIGSFFTVNIIFWGVFSLITILKDYKRLTLVFFICMLTGTLMIYLTYNILGLKSILIFYSLAYSVLITYSIIDIMHMFPSKKNISFDFFFIKDRFKLALSGTMYNIAIWIDKYIMWYFSPYRKNLTSFFNYNPAYDINFFIASLFIIPILSIITIVIETRLAESFELFTEIILSKKGIEKITQQKKEIYKSIKYGYEIILKYQGLITLFIIFYSDYFFRHLENNHILKLLIIGSFMLAFFIYQTLILFYMDSKKEFLESMVIFISSNVLFTFLSLNDIRFYGTGYTLSLLLTNLFMFFVIQNTISKFDYILFRREKK